MSPLIVIVGETASGKSSLALELARRLNGEIICADSWTVYKGFDIGTAKPTIDEQKLVRHHLLDVTTADKGFSAPQFQRLALVAIDDITARGKLPIMVGGTGLYIDSVIFDYSFLPPSSTSERAKLNGLELVELLAIASKRGLPLDTIDAQNKRRVIRLIENDGQLPSRTSLRPNTLVLGLALARSELEAKITSRVDKMLSAGLAHEVKTLAGQFGWLAEPMKGVGYKEWQGYFDGRQTLAATREKIIKSSLDLAKKQRIWFKRHKFIHWLTNRDELAETVELVTTFLNK